MTTLTTDVDPVASNTVRYVISIIVCLTIGFFVGWFVRGAFAETELRDARIEMAIEQIGGVESFNQSLANRIQSSTESDTFVNPMKITIPFLYGMGVGGALDFYMLVEPENSAEVCAYITAHLEESGAKNLADLPVGQSLKNELMDQVEEVLTNAGIDCSDSMKEW